MKIIAHQDANAGSIFLERPASGRTVMLGEHVIAAIADDGRLTAVEVLDLDAWGRPFDTAAAERVLAWVRAHLDAEPAQ